MPTDHPRKATYGIYAARGVTVLHAKSDLPYPANPATGRTRPHFHIRYGLHARTGSDLEIITAFAPVRRAIPGIAIHIIVVRRQLRPPVPAISWDMLTIARAVAVEGFIADVSADASEKLANVRLFACAVDDCACLAATGHPAGVVREAELSGSRVTLPA